MHTHIKIVAFINIVRGALGLLGAAAVLFGGLFGGMLSVFGDGGLFSWVAMSVAGVVGSVIIGALALVSVVAGFALLNHRSWARYLVIILSVFGLFKWPVGTLLSGYTLWVLLHRETRTIFDTAP